MVSILIVAGGTGRAAFRASVLAIAEICPRPIFEAVVCVGVTRIAAKAARCASSVLGIRVIFPTSVFQRMVLRSAGADVGITDAAIFFDCMLRFITQNQITQKVLWRNSEKSPVIDFFIGYLNTFSVDQSQM